MNSAVQRWLKWFADLYPVWLIGSAVVGLSHPPALAWFSGQWVVWALSLVMLGMGFTLTVEDFRRLFRMPGSLALGFLAHYTVMPLTGWMLARMLHLDAGFAVGLILVASCPSGTASNVISFLARANVALAVMVTLTSTLMAFVMTPLWCKTLAGTYVPVDALKLCLSTLQVAIAPVLIGVGCNWRFPKAVAKVSTFGPAVSVLAIIFITGGIVAKNADAVIANAGKLAVASLLLHVIGFAVGYRIARLLRYPDDVARTISIEVGMQNGGLAAVLAAKNFPQQPMAAVPAVFSAVAQNLVGSIIASYWRKHPPVSVHPRASIYYWKCDRTAAFHGTDETFHRNGCEQQLHTVLQKQFPGQTVALEPAASQGNHITWFATINGTEMFVRIENGPEHDDYIEVESRILDEVRKIGVPTPRIYAVDGSRRDVSFAWQAIERIRVSDLNTLYKEGRLDLPKTAAQIGSSIAKWQTIQHSGYGPFNPRIQQEHHTLEGFHKSYADYFLLNLDRHLQFLVKREFLSATESRSIKDEIRRQRGLLNLDRGCLVHKDLALWNILGTESQIVSYIDWDDAISGDPMDDLSLLACFYDRKILAHALEGYSNIRPLPPEHCRRFWLHLLRNMIVKSVIRVGAGYFERSDNFFLIESGKAGIDLKSFTRARLSAALDGLRENRPIESL